LLSRGIDYNTCYRGYHGRRMLMPSDARVAAQALDSSDCSSPTQRMGGRSISDAIRLLNLQVRLGGISRATASNEPITSAGGLQKPTKGVLVAVTGPVVMPSTPVQHRHARLFSTFESARRTSPPEGHASPTGGSGQRRPVTSYGACGRQHWL